MSKANIKEVVREKYGQAALASNQALLVVVVTLQGWTLLAIR